MCVPEYLPFPNAFAHYMEKCKSNWSRCSFAQILWSNNWASKGDQYEALFKEKKKLMWRKNFLQDLFCFVEAAVPQNYYPALNMAGLQTDFTSCKVWVNVSLLVRNFFLLQEPFPGGSLGSKAKSLWMTVALAITCNCRCWRHCDRAKHKCYLEISATQKFNHLLIQFTGLTEVASMCKWNRTVRLLAKLETHVFDFK